MRRLIVRFGDSQRAPDVSIGFLCRYSLSQRRLQSQMKGFLAKCLQQQQRRRTACQFEPSTFALLFFSLSPSLMVRESAQRSGARERACVCVCAKAPESKTFSRRGVGAQAFFFFAHSSKRGLFVVASAVQMRLYENYTRDSARVGL